MFNSISTKVKNIFAFLKLKLTKQNEHTRVTALIALNARTKYMHLRCLSFDP